MHRAIIYSIVISFVLAAAVSGCTHSADYRRALNKATHKGQMYDPYTWDANVIWHATFFSDDFRHAFEEEHALVNDMGPVEKERWMAKQDELHNQFWEFYVSIYTKQEYKEFSLNPNSFWKIELTTADGEKVRPLLIEPVTKPKRTYGKYMYTYLDRWSKAYRVRFPKIYLGKQVHLTLKSILGKSNLTWNLKNS